MRIVNSLIDGEFRKKGECYEVVGSLRANRFKYKDKNGVVHSTEKQKGWNILKKIYKDNYII